MSKDLDKLLLKLNETAQRKGTAHPDFGRAVDLLSDEFHSRFGRLRQQPGGRQSNGRKKGLKRSPLDPEPGPGDL